MIIKNPLIIKKAKLQAKIATPTTSSQTIVADSNYDGLSSVEISAVDHTIDSNITAGNIKKDVTILGVTGTLESGSGDDKFVQLVERTATEITANDLSGITSIGKYAFYYYDKLTSITIPDSVTSIGESAFYGCSGVTSVIIGSETIGYGSFSFCINLTSLTLGNSVKSIGSSAFNNCKKLSSIVFPDSVEYIGSNSFYNCNSLKSVTFGKGLKQIAFSAFSSIGALESPIVLGDNLVSIGEGAFKSCGIPSVTIGSAITSIGESAFYGCSKLTEMTILATTPPTLGNTNAISSATTTIYIPAGTLSAYQTATNWSNFADKFVELSE